MRETGKPIKCSACGQDKTRPVTDLFNRDYPLDWCADCIHDDIDFKYREWCAQPNDVKERLTTLQQRKKI